MREFKIRKIDKEYSRFVVEIEFLDNEDRRKFGYPLGEFWDEEIDGKPRFIKDIARQVSEEEEKIMSLNIEKLKKFEGLKVSDNDLKKKTIKSHIDDNSGKKG